MVRAAIAQRTGREKHQGRTQPLAAALHDILCHLAHQSDVGMQALPDHRVDGRHIRRDQFVELLHSQDTAPGHKNSEILGADLLRVKQGMVFGLAKPLTKQEKYV